MPARVLKVHAGGRVGDGVQDAQSLDLIGFLDLLDDEIPVVEDQQIVAISDNLSTRGTQEVKDWLQAHPRWRFEFTPTHASWLDTDRDLLRDPLPTTAQARRLLQRDRPCPADARVHRDLQPDR